MTLLIDVFHVKYNLYILYSYSTFIHFLGDNTSLLITINYKIVWSTIFEKYQTFFFNFKLNYFENK